MAGICLIRLERLRPSLGLRALDIGLSSHNAAYRIAVEWTDDATGAAQQGVYIPRRDTSSTLQHSLGGRVFPGDYHLSRFTVVDSSPHLSVNVHSTDGLGDVELEATEADLFAAGSVFPSIDEASTFFEQGAVGYSARRSSPDLDGLLLQTDGWQVRPLHVKRVESSFFEKALGLSEREAVFDNALIMRDVRHTWNALPRLSQERV